MTLAIETNHLSYSFGNRIGLDDITLKIPWGTTTLIVGPNGAGKSTLLKILAGKTLIPKNKLLIDGCDPFDLRAINTNTSITYLGTEWAANSVIKRDIPVLELIDLVGGEAYPERRERLMKIMDVDTRWLMLRISDGERRRVQIVMGLIKPWRLLLLDEVTVDLDVVVRQGLLQYLKDECRDRQCSVVYATHIFDGLGRKWCDRLLHIVEGSIRDDIDMSTVTFTLGKLDIADPKHFQIPYSESIHPLALQWLTKDLGERGTRDDADIRLQERNRFWFNQYDN